MPPIVYNTLHAPTSLSKTEDIKSWDTEKYLKTLSKFNNDNIFNDQISKITEKQYDFDKTATNENYYNLNLYDIYFQPCSNIIEENITRILQFQYSNSPTFRRLVNYHTDNLPNYDINKCQIYITNTFAYNKKEDSVSELFIALDEKGNFIVPKTESLEEISPEKILLNFFLKHISNPDILGYDDIDTYTNIIFKELSPQAIAHTSKSFQHASVRDKYKLYDCENSTKQIDNIEQVISKGSTLQKEFFDSYIKNKELDPIPSQKKGIQFKKIALNGLLLTSGLFQTLNNNQHSGNSNSLDKINVRHSRSLPEEHSAPAETKSSSIVKGINEFILKKAASLYNLLTNLELELQLENYIRGYHELLAFSQTGIWTRNGRDAARNYIVEIMKQHFYKFEIEYNSGRVVFFQDFIEKHREYEYNIYETFARDIIVHPLPFDLDYAPPEKGGIIRSEPANHYMQTVRQKFSHSAPLHFDNLYGKESIFLSVALHDLKSNKKLSKRDFEHLFKIAQLVIHHLSKDGGDKILCSSYGVKYHRLILNEIVTRCKHHQRHINESIIEKISLAIITNNDLSNQIKSKILKLNSQKNYCNPWLMILATEKQLSWAEAHYKAQKHIESHIQDCELLGLMDTNKMVRDAITGFIHQINEITESSWMSSEEQHAKKILALEMFKTKISTLNGGQGFVYGFNKVIQEGLGGLIELSFDIDDEWHHRALSSLSPASRNGLHLLGTIWNIVMSAVPGFNALAGTSSILNHAVVEKSTDVCSYIQDAIRIGMEAVPVAESKFTKKSSNSKYIGLRFVEEKINKNLINEPLQRGSSYRVIESIENTDFIYQKITKKILELMTTENNELYSATGFNNENYGYYKRSGDGFYRKQHSFQPLSKETPNKITYNNRELELIKESNSEIYCGTFTDNGKNSIVKFYKSSDGSFYQAEGLKGGGLIRHTDKPYSELKEGDIGYDEELLDITDDSPELEETLPAISEDLYPSEEENVQNIYSKFKSGDIEAGMTEVTLCRGTIASQAENIVSYSTAGGAEIANPNVNPVSEDIAKLQIKSGRIEPEYTTDISVADRFSRGHHLVIVKVRVKYLTRGSISESGWIIPQNAPIEPVGLIDRTYGQPENIQQANAS